MTSREDADKLAAIDRRDGVRTMMGTQQSRRVMWEMFEVMGIYRVSPSTEPSALAFNEGRRSLALEIMNGLLVHAPEQYDLMVAENRARLARETEEQERQE